MKKNKKPLIILLVFLINLSQVHCGWFDWASPAWQPSKATMCAGVILACTGIVAWNQANNKQTLKDNQYTFNTIHESWNGSSKPTRQNNPLLNQNAAILNKVHGMADIAYETDQKTGKVQKKWNFYTGKFSQNAPGCFEERTLLSLKEAVLNLDCQKDEDENKALVKHQADAAPDALFIPSHEITRLDTTDRNSKTWQQIKKEISGVKEPFFESFGYERGEKRLAQQPILIKNIVEKEAEKLNKKLDKNARAFLNKYKINLTKLGVNLERPLTEESQAVMTYELGTFFKNFCPKKRDGSTVPTLTETIDHNFLRTENNYKNAIQKIEDAQKNTFIFSLAALCGWLGWRAFVNK